MKPSQAEDVGVGLSTQNFKKNTKPFVLLKQRKIYRVPAD
jgi:hypothetical protein